MNDKNSGPKTLKLSATDQHATEYEIQVVPMLRKWALTVYKLPTREVVTEDFFPDRKQAVGRAYDFRSIIVSREAAISHETA